jgi:hypothetical protein
MSLRIKKGVDICEARFDSRINSWRNLVRESGGGATPNRCTYSVHLTTFSKKLEETWSESFNTRPEPRSTWRVSLKLERALGNFAEIGRSSTLGESSLGKHSGVVDDI